MAEAAAPSAARGMAESQRAYSVGRSQTTSAVAGDTTAERFMQNSNQSRFSGGKTFYLNGETWVDSEVQKLSKAERVQLRVGTPEYLELGKQHPRVLPWLALGTNVHFAFQGKVYEVTNN
jgi:hypothetical protein